jgi:hypothetical protein
MVEVHLGAEDEDTAHDVVPSDPHYHSAGNTVVVDSAAVHVRLVDSTAAVAAAAAAAAADIDVGVVVPGSGNSDGAEAVVVADRVEDDDGTGWDDAVVLVLLVLVVLHVDILPPLDQNLLESNAECPSWTDEYGAGGRWVLEPTFA